jgi:hypothetical protein
MRELFKQFAAYNGLEKLNVVANCFTILGISVATVAVGPFVDKFSLYSLHVDDLLIAIVMALLCLWLLLSCFAVLFKWIGGSLQSGKYLAAVPKTAVLLLLAWLFTVTVPPSFVWVGRALGVSYLLPVPAALAVKNVSYDWNNGPESKMINGHVELDDDVLQDDYLVLLYTRTGIDGRLYIHKAGPVWIQPRQEQFGISAQGSFFISDIGIDGISELQLAVFRKTDSSLWKRIDTGKSFPNGVASIEDVNITSLEPYCVDASSLLGDQDIGS